MELDDNTKQTYIELLSDILKKKSEVLDKLMKLSEEQEELISEETFDDDQFMELIAEKEEQLEVLNKLDNGFERVYSAVKEEIFSNKASYLAEITELKKLISYITDSSVKLQAIEKRNKAKLEMLFALKRNRIKMSRINNKSAANYYKSMSGQLDSQSYFYDKKK